MTEERKPFFGECTECAHRWIILFTPMEISRASRAMKRAACPMCGGIKVTVPKQANGVLSEPQSQEAPR